MTEYAVRTEVIREPLALFFGGRVQQPHQQEERHHRGHEIGIGDFPGAAMMAARDNLLPSYDDGSSALFVSLTGHVILTRRNAAPIFAVRRTSPAPAAAWFSR